MKGVSIYPRWTHKVIHLTKIVNRCGTKDRPVLIFRREWVVWHVEWLLDEFSATVCITAKELMHEIAEREPGVFTQKYLVIRTLHCL